jgi:hypothetical protein
MRACFLEIVFLPAEARMCAHTAAFAFANDTIEPHLQARIQSAIRSIFAIIDRPSVVDALAPAPAADPTAAAVFSDGADSGAAAAVATTTAHSNGTNGAHAAAVAVPRPPAPATRGPAQGRIEFKRVVFRYPSRPARPVRPVYACGVLASSRGVCARCI